MGGHKAWKKRVARGELAKGSGGAIMRHRPRLGRRGKDLILNRKGHIAGGNPKKLKKLEARRQRLRALKDAGEGETKQGALKKEEAMAAAGDDQEKESGRMMEDETAPISK